ncbi:MAG: S41 family peptidase [Deltaproteobacteria bacterium]|nr:S41 family peptidase [Candidatus Zymogenaceae bacterium]
MSAANGRLRIVIVFVLVFLIGISVGKGMDKVLAASTTGTYKNLEQFIDVLNLIKENYVDEVDAGTLVTNAIRGMVSGLDPHSVFFTPDEYEDFQVGTTGSFGGLGIELGIIDSYPGVISPIEDTPAWRIGLKAGDKIVAIEGKPTDGMTIMEAVKQLRGEPGTKVTVSIMRKGFTKPRDYTIIREIINTKSIKYEVYDNNIAYVRIMQFQERTSTDLRAALDAIVKKTDGNIRGIILDLRNDPGGLLNKSVEVADDFISEGIIVYTKGRVSGSDMTFTAKKDGTLPSDIPMVVLVNGGSASASEIVAGALKDHKRAIIVGEKTYGKGSVQSIIPLPDGSGLKITTAKYFTPSGISIQDKGIVPDIVIENKEPEETTNGNVTETEEEMKLPDAQLDKAKEVILNWNDYKGMLSQ